uniref:NF-kappa-B essential modulator n=1 Tax=Acanthochromis polyacanthus TaxID=80966 RepID=A0A3Q1HA76_9TELE
MVQPQPDGPMQWDMSGEDSGGALRVPPELAANEVVTKLLGDNQQLREALRRSNLALRQRCEEMEGWQRRTREEREFLSCRFQEARALVERLAQENHSLQGLVNGPASSSNHSCSSSQTEDLQGQSLAMLNWLQPSVVVLRGFCIFLCRLCSKVKALQVAEREQEQQRKQHHVAMDKLLLQTQSLEQALKTERHVVTEEKKKLTQLQHAYTCLFRDYDSKLKSEVKTHLRDLCSRLEEAERALALKQDLIDKLKEEVEQQKGSLETVPVLTAQAEIYKADFLAEREAREKLNQKKEELQDQLNKAMTDIERLKQEATSRARMEQMKLRHLEDFPARPPNIPPPQGAAGVEDLPDLCCPKCQYLAPDMDTLQIHVMDCIQ